MSTRTRVGFAIVVVLVVSTLAAFEFPVRSVRLTLSAVNIALLLLVLVALARRAL